MNYFLRIKFYSYLIFFQLNSSPSMGIKDLDPLLLNDLEYLQHIIEINYTLGLQLQRHLIRCLRLLMLRIIPLILVALWFQQVCEFNYLLHFSIIFITYILHQFLKVSIEVFTNQLCNFTGNHLSQQEEAAARAAASKHIYLSAASQGRNVYSDRDRAAAAALHQRSLAPPPAAHSAVSAAAAAAVYSRPGLASISGFQRYTNLPSAVTTANSAMLASSISSSPRTNGTGPPPTGSRYYRD